MQNTKSKLFLNFETQWVFFSFVETYMTTNSTTAIHWNNYQNASTDGRQSMLMIGIGVLAAAALFIIFVILYTYRLENVNNETESKINYSVK